MAYVGAFAIRTRCDCSRDDSANAYAHASKSSGTHTDGSSCKPGSSFFVSITAFVSVETAGSAKSSCCDLVDDSENSDGSDCDSAVTGEMAIGVRIPTKPAMKSRKEARIAIYE